MIPHSPSFPPRAATHDAHTHRRGRGASARPPPLAAPAPEGRHQPAPSTATPDLRPCAAVLAQDMVGSRASPTPHDAAPCWASSSGRRTPPPTPATPSLPRACCHALRLHCELRREIPLPPCSIPLPSPHPVEHRASAAAMGDEHHAPESPSACTRSRALAAPSASPR